MSDALIIDACRTPRGIGKQGKGALAHLHPQHLARTVLEALVERNGFDTADVDDVVWGTSAQVAEQGGDLGRMAALDAGYDITASGMNVKSRFSNEINSQRIGSPYQDEHFGTVLVDWKTGNLTLQIRNLKGTPIIQTQTNLSTLQFPKK